MIDHPWLTWLILSSVAYLAAAAAGDLLLAL
jgi:hypothetical protein